MTSHSFLGFVDAPESSDSSWDGFTIIKSSENGLYHVMHNAEKKVHILVRLVMEIEEEQKDADVAEMYKSESTAQLAESPSKTELKKQETMMTTAPANPAEETVA